MVCFRTLVLSSALVFAASEAMATPQEANSDSRANATLSHMTQSEKLQMVFGYFSTEAPWKNFHVPKGGLADSAGFIPGIDHLGLPAQWQTDAGIGVATQRSPRPRERTALPSGLATAATWNRDLAFSAGAMIGHEARLSGFNVMLAGGANLARDPRNGRNFEYAGEDPLLAGTMVGQQIRGIQSNHIISTLKHFAFNDQSTSQSDLDSHIDDASARTSDLLAFQLAYEIGDPGSVMCSYNLVKGDYACESRWLLTEVLKDDWGFKGYVMTDWGATHSTIKAANSGLDQQSGYPFGDVAYFGPPLQAALATNQVSESRLDDMARRVLRSLYACGLVDDPVLGDQSSQIDLKADAGVSEADAEESLVLLKNNGVLPLASSVSSIAVIGGHADLGVLSGGGSSQVYPVGGSAVPNEGPANFPGPMVWYPSSPVTELKQLTKAKITYLNGNDIKAAAQLAAKSDIAIVFATEWSAEGMDQSGLKLPRAQDDLISAVAQANKRTIVVLETGDPVTMPWLDKTAAVIEAWFPGTAGGKAIARVLSGDVNPSGRLPITFPASLDQLPRPVLDGTETSLLKGRTLIANYDLEGAAVGYKWYDKKGLKPLFPFGYGLSYSSYEMSDLLPVDVTSSGLTMRFSVKNTGAAAGKEVAEIYISGMGWESPKRLGGFAKLDLAPGETKSASVTLDPRLMSRFDSARKTWILAEGDYVVMLATSAEDVRATAKVHLNRMEFDVRGKPIT